MYNLYLKGLIILKEKILELLQSTDGYISGEKMSEEVNISRAAVWKHIKKLRSEGFEIHSVTNKGYRLINSPDIISPEKIKQLLTTEFIGRHIFFCDTIDTTNDWAKSNSDQPDGSVFIAEVQTHGKGSRGRHWTSPRGSGIWHTILLKPPISPMQVSQITLIAGLAACQAIGGNAMIKWPNDIVIDGKKISGTLTEMSAEINMVNYVVCGIGINVNTTQFPDDLNDKATSMYIQHGKTFDRNEIIARLLNRFEYYYNKYVNSGLESIMNDYRQSCVTIGREVQVIFNKETVLGLAVDVDNEGRLTVQTENGIIHVTSGEVSVRGIYGYI